MDVLNPHKASSIVLQGKSSVTLNPPLITLADPLSVIVAALPPLSRDRGSRDSFSELRRRVVRLAEDAARKELLTRRKEEELKTRERKSVLVNRLHPKVTESDLYRYFNEKVGNVLSVKLIRDRNGKSKGLGYVEFPDEDFVLKAVLLNGALFRGHPVSITESMAEKNQQAEELAQQLKAYDEAPSSIFVDKIPKELDQQQVNELFEPFGPVTEVKLGVVSTNECRRCNSAWIYFNSPQPAARAFNTMNGFKVFSSRLTVSYKGEEVQSLRGVG
ncbi:hypothetical protein GEMRC1_007050 [Eukaryota sp. GEM-RC1]